jgi:hypothetical protein
MEALLDVTVLFTLVLAFSFVIERFLEVLKAVYDLLDSRLDWYKFWTQLTNKLKDRLEKRMRIFEYVDPQSVQSILQRFRGMFLNEQGEYSGTVPVLAGDLVRTVSVKVVIKFIGIAAGIGLALWLKIDLIDVWIKASGNAKWIEKITSPNFNYVISGIAMGLGSSPVHKIITKIERKQKEIR